MPEFPAITHVALTVSDLGRSRPWYQQLFGSDPLIDEDTGPFHHVVWLMGGTLVGIHQFPDLKSSDRSTSVGQAWTISPLPVPVDPSSRSGSVV